MQSGLRSRTGRVPVSPPIKERHPVVELLLRARGGGVEGGLVGWGEVRGVDMGERKRHKPNQMHESSSYFPPERRRRQQSSAPHAAGLPSANQRASTAERRPPIIEQEASSPEHWYPIREPKGSTPTADQRAKKSRTPVANQGAERNQQSFTEQECCFDSV